MCNKTIALFLSVFIATLVICECNSERNGYKLYLVRIRSEQEKQYIHSLSFKTGYLVFGMPNKLNGTCKVAAGFERQKDFEEAMAIRFMAYSVLALDLEAYLEKIHPHYITGRPLALTKIDFEQFYQTVDLNFYLDHLKSQYPKLLHISSLGRSTEKRPLKAVKISTGGKKKDVIIIAAGIHGRELIAPAAAFFTIHQLVENQSQNKELLSSFDWIILPLVNPDGYDYSLQKDLLWLKTRSSHGKCTGTDIDRNFSFEWKGNMSSSDPCNQHYRGPEPFSEPETRAVLDIFEHYRGRVKAFITLRADGRRICHPWAYTRQRPVRESQLQKVAMAGVKAIYEKSGQYWEIVSQAQADEEANGASIDYAYRVERIPFVYRIELESGGFTGFDPNVTDIKPMVERYWAGMKAVAKILAKVPKAWVSAFNKATLAFFIGYKNLLFSQIYPVVFIDNYSTNFI